jgi:2-dehydropantoate 2-reductase
VPFYLRLKIAVVGCGAVGSYYGAKLCRAGQEVHFLLRSDYAAVCRDGVLIRSPEGDFRVQPRCARLPGQIGWSDLVLIALKTTANHRFRALVPPLVGPQTAVVSLQNGLGNERALAALVGAEKVLGGLCFVCLNRVAPGVIAHTAHGRVELGEFQRPPAPRTHALAAVFQSAGVPCAVVENLERAHWEKLVWNIPFNGLGVAGVAGYEAVLAGRLKDRGLARACLPTDQLLGEPRWRQLLRELMGEVIAAANALGFPIPASLADCQISRTLCMGAYKASTLLDFERGRPLELKSLFLEPLRQAQRAGVPTPRLAALCAVLAELDSLPQP